jgi:transposase InsO family protein
MCGPGRPGVVAFILDVFSRMVVGWQLAGHLGTDLPWTRWRWASGAGRSAMAS